MMTKIRRNKVGPRLCEIRGFHEAAGDFQS